MSVDAQKGALAVASKLLGKRFRVRTPDERIIVGDFTCMDKQGNLVLNNAVEEYSYKEKVEERPLGSVVISKSQRSVCDVIPSSDADKQDLETLLKSFP